MCRATLKHLVFGKSLQVSVKNKYPNRKKVSSLVFPKTEKNQQGALPPEVLFFRAVNRQRAPGGQGRMTPQDHRAVFHEAKGCSRNLFLLGVMRAVCREKSVFGSSSRGGGDTVVCFYGGHQRELLRYVSASNPTDGAMCALEHRRRDRRRPVINPTDLHFKSQ